MSELAHRDLSGNIIGARIEVHRELGPGLLASAYEECRCYEPAQRRLQFERQVSLPVLYKNVRLACGYLIDLIVESVVQIELKSVESLLPVHEAQILAYLELTGLQVGLLVNFNVPLLKNGVKRFIH